MRREALLLQTTEYYTRNLQAPGWRSVGDHNLLRYQRWPALAVSYEFPRFSRLQVLKE